MKQAVDMSHENLSSRVERLALSSVPNTLHGASRKPYVVKYGSSSRRRFRSPLVAQDFGIDLTIWNAGVDHCSWIWMVQDSCNRKKLCFLISDEQASKESSCVRPLITPAFNEQDIFYFLRSSTVCCFADDFKFPPELATKTLITRGKVTAFLPRTTS